MAKSKKSEIKRENGGSERDAAGRFLPGSKGGPGNPKIRKLAEHRAAISRAVSADDLERIMRKLVELAIGGDIQAAREVLDRTVGKPKQTVEVEDEAATTGRVWAAMIAEACAVTPSLASVLGARPHERN